MPAKVRHNKSWAAAPAFIRARRFEIWSRMGFGSSSRLLRRRFWRGLAAFGFLVGAVFRLWRRFWVSAADRFLLGLKLVGGAAGSGSNSSTAAQQGAAPDRLQPCVSLVPRFTSGFRRRVSLVVVPRAPRLNLVWSTLALKGCRVRRIVSFGFVGRCGLSARGGSMLSGLRYFELGRVAVSPVAWHSVPTRGTTRRCTRPPPVWFFLRLSGSAQSWS